MGRNPPVFFSRTTCKFETAKNTARFLGLSSYKKPGDFRGKEPMGGGENEGGRGKGGGRKERENKVQLRVLKFPAA